MDNSIVKKYQKQIKGTFSVDDFTLKMLEGECYRPQGGLSLIGKYPFLFHCLLSLITNLIYPLYGLKRKVSASDEDFLFLSCPDTSFRTKTLDLIAKDLKYSIIYLPNFHVTTSIKYHQFFKNKGIQVFFPTFKISQILRAKKRIWKLTRSIKDLTASFECKRMISVLSSYAIYDEVVKDYMEDIQSFHGKWILEHQKFYFMAAVSNLRQKGISSSMLQHGVFFEPIYDYIPLLCDHVLCCSEREKRIYVENGTDEDRVTVFGAPLQTLEKGIQVNTNERHYDVLVLMTIVSDLNIELKRDVLNYLNENCNSILVRMRPRSRKEDIALLSDVLNNMTISKPGTTIGEDIVKCDKVVSFSVDANIEASKYHKPFVYIWYGDNEDYVNQVHCATRDTFKDEINKLLKQDFYSSFDEEQYKEILGETDTNILNERFKLYIKQV